jgi:sulfoxide reductase catalytic subunit YedY
MTKIDPSEITPKHLYLSRRRFIKGLGLAAAGAVVATACGNQEDATTATATAAPTEASETATPAAKASPTPVAVETAAPLPTLSADADDMGNELTSLQAINSYNNYYEFTFSKEGVGTLAKDFQTVPWTVEVGGLVKNPKSYSMQELLGFTQQERIYRMRCVEAWSMVIPWIGFPLAELLAQVEPTSEAQYVRFEAPNRPDQMPNQSRSDLPWPYVEGLRLDEAMHDLTILATGIYGEPLLPQTGAPIRLVVPWKYGFKSIKSIVKIELVAEMPTSLWMAQAPHEYGFYANVNPDVPHPRWSQATERRIGENTRRKTLLFNGYEDEVAHLYEGMDLVKWS